MVIYELDIYCVVCRQITKDVSCRPPVMGERWHTFCPCNSTRISIIDSVEAEEEITDRKEIEEWTDMFRSIGVSDAHEVIYAPGGEEVIDRVVKMKVWIYPVGSLRNLREQEERWELEKVEKSDNPDLGRFVFTFRWKGVGVEDLKTQVYANGEIEARRLLEP